MSTQTLAVGSTPQSRYGIGTQGQRVVKPLNRLFTLLIGPPGEGKTTLLQSCPTGLLINLDKSSTPGDHTIVPTCTVWPSMNGTGAFVDEQGREFGLTWEAVRDVVTFLIQRAKNGEPRPTTIFFDSIGEWISLLKDFVRREAGKNDWHDLDGRRGWDTVYDTIITTCNELLNYYGVVIVGHLVNAKIPLGDDRFTIRPEMTITDAFYKRLYGKFDMVAAVAKERRTRTAFVESPPLPDGRKVPPKRVEQAVDEYIFCVDRADLSGIVKQRVKMPSSIPFGMSGGWSAIEAEYNKSAYTSGSSTTE